MALNLMCAVLDRGPVDLSEMAVLLAIADSADKDTGEAWPSQARIAARARQTDRSVRNVLERLRLGGWLTWEKRLRANGSQASNVYTINLAKLGEAPRNVVPPPRNVVPPPPERGSTHAPERGSTLEPSHHLEPCADDAERVQSAPLRPAMRGPGLAVGSVAGLSSFQRSRILSGQSLVVDGVPVKPGSPQMDTLRQALLSQDAGELGGVACRPL